jgi:TP901 family phage tail tape measure protein
LADYVEHVEITGDASSYESALDRATAKTRSATASWISTLDRTGRSMQRVGRSATTYLSLPLVGAGIAAVKMSNDFSQSMANVDSIIKVSGDTLARYANQILDLSTEVPQSAKILADGLYDVASSGFQGADGMTVLRAAAVAASAGMTDTATSAKAITAALNAYGLSADDAAAVSDILFKGVDKGVIRFEELANSMGDYVAAAAALKIPLQDVVAAQAAMTLSGLNAFEAATSLNNILRSLLKPSEAMTKALKAMGVESGQAALESFGLQGIIERLSERVGNNQKEWVELFPEIRAARGAMALATNDGKNLNTVMDAMADRAGATGAALDRVAKGGTYQWQLALQRLQKGMIELGNAVVPILTEDIIPAVLNVVEAFTSLSDSQQSLIVKAALVAAALGPVLLVLGSMLRLVSGVTGGLIKLGGGMQVAAAAAGTLAPAMAASASGTAAAASNMKLYVANASGAVVATKTLAPATVATAAATTSAGKAFLSGAARAGAYGAALLGVGGAVETYLGYKRQLSDQANEVAQSLLMGVGSLKQWREEAEKATSGTKPGGSGWAGPFSVIADFFGDRATLQSIEEGGVIVGKALERIQALPDVGRLAAAQQAVAGLTDRFRDGKISAEVYHQGLENIYSDYRLMFPSGEKLIEQHHRMVSSLGRFSEEVMGATGITDKQRKSLETLIPGFRKLGIHISDSRKALIESLLANGNYIAATALLKGEIEDGLLPVLRKHRSELTKVQVEQIQTAIKAGNTKRAMDLLAQAIKDIPKKTDPQVNVHTHGEEGLAALEARLTRMGMAPYTVDLIVRSHGGTGGLRGTQQALGGITRAAAGMIVRTPTVLAGEGGYQTFAGRGAEANIPLDTRGIGILGKALKMAGAGQIDTDALARALAKAMLHQHPVQIDSHDVGRALERRREQLG